MDDFTRLGFVAMALALEDAGLNGGTGTNAAPAGALASSSFGCLRTDQEYYETVLPQEGRLASPNLFAYTVPNSFLGEVAIRYGLTGPSFVLSETDPNGLEPLRLAMETITWGECPTVVAGVSDLPPPVGAGSPSTLPAGAVFVVLGAGPDEGPAPFGDLCATPDGILQWEGSPVPGLAELVKRVLADREQSAVRAQASD
jgi:3-oxoacyl-[acyl-carrier-protein] synthase II